MLNMKMSYQQVCKTDGTNSGAAVGQAERKEILYKLAGASASNETVRYLPTSSLIKAKVRNHLTTAVVTSAQAPAANRAHSRVCGLT